jgi:hypothetical protein
MQKVFNKVVDKTTALTQKHPTLKTSTSSPSTPPSNVPPITGADVVRYRYQHGCNLGTIFVLERWLSGSMFGSDAAGGSELDAIRS